MIVDCIWEHNGNDTLLYAANLPGAYSRGENLQIAIAKMKQEIKSYLLWIGYGVTDALEIRVVQDSACDLQVSDADSDVLFDSERTPLTLDEYLRLKGLALKSARNFLSLYDAIPDKSLCIGTARKTFYGLRPRSADQMYEHTKSVNAYYFGEIDVPADNAGTILECRVRGFEALEQKPHFLRNSVVEGSYGELWTVRKMLRRFIWHDRIHAKAMYRLAVNLFGAEKIPDLFCFGDTVCTRR